MPFPSVTYTFVNGSTADATQVNQNFTDLINGLSDGTKSLNISAVTCGSTATFNSNVTVGTSSSNTLTINASIAANVVFSANGSWDIGGSTLGVKSLYLGGGSTNTLRLISGTVSASWTLTFPTSAGTARYRMETDGSGTTSWQPVRRTGTDAQNLALAVSVSGNACTVALKTLINNTDPSATDPIDVVFRSTTATTGQPSVVSITGALSVVIADTVTLGAVIGIPSYFYVYLINNAGTAELALSLSGAFDEGQLVTTTAIAAGTSATTLYSTSARASVPCRLIGRFQITLGASSHWSASPVEVSTLGFQSKRQLEIGTTQTANGTTTSASYAAPSNTCSLTFTAKRTGYYRIYSTPFIGFNSTAGQTIRFQIIATAGSPSITLTPIVILDTTASYATALNNTSMLFGIVQLTAGTSYTFQLQAQTTSGTLTVAFATMNAALIAEEM